ncbi:MAG: lysophospholipid acyltransferase family protein [Candidatus Limnocylindrales bacterium]|jgi:1-acyl-sn-glycerol-3-phosphate acyltransferase
MSTPLLATVPPDRRGRRLTRSGSGWLDEQAPARSMWRYGLARFVSRLIARGYSGFRLEGAERLPPGPSIVCFSHQNWVDPLYLMAALPARPRTSFFGPQAEDMTRGLRNGLMRWTGVAIPYRPGKRGLVAAMRRVAELLAGGGRVAIAGEGRIHAGEGVILPLLEGPAYMSLRSGVPLVPVAINGTSWLAFRRRVRVRVGQPIEPPAEARSGLPDSPTPAAVRALTDQARQALLELVADFPDPARSRWIGGRLTELFNDWPEGSRPPTPPKSGSAGAGT